MSQRAAIRRRAQWGIKFRHLAKVGRPIFAREVSTDKAQRRLMQVIEKQRAMQGRKKAKA